MVCYQKRNDCCRRRKIIGEKWMSEDLEAKDQEKDQEIDHEKDEYEDFCYICKIL